MSELAIFQGNKVKLQRQTLLWQQFTQLDLTEKIDLSCDKIIHLGRVRNIKLLAHIAFFEQVKEHAIPIINQKRRQ